MKLLAEYTAHCRAWPEPVVLTCYDGAGGPGGRCGAMAGRSMNGPRCEGVTKAGGRCRSFALPGSGRCIAHDPERAGLMRRARRKGAEKAGRLRVLRGKRARLDTPRALARFLSDLAQAALAGSVAVDVARTVAYICAVQRQVVEASELERRLAELEARMGQGNVRAGRW